jgi:hypothetical protein
MRSLVIPVHEICQEYVEGSDQIARTSAAWQPSNSSDAIFHSSPEVELKDIHPGLGAERGPVGQVANSVRR